MPTPHDEVPQTRRDVAPEFARTRRDGAVEGPSAGMVPAALREEFTPVRRVAAAGAEAELIVVEDAAGREFVVKKYHRGYRADRHVWQEMRNMSTTHVVRILRTGEDDGRDYELQEYITGGSLADALTGETPWPPARITEAVRQLADALADLHRHDIVHRDIKPANVLIRSADPLDLALADFGLSRGIDASVVFATTSRTLAYAPPESFAGETSRPWDWWSLGILTLELALGRSPFQGMTEQAVMHHLLTSAMDLNGVADPRLRLLCGGLLVRDPAKRWGRAQVSEWLAGGSPPVAPDPAQSGPAPASRPPALRFLGERYTDRAALARAMAAQWNDARRRFLTKMGTPKHPSESWRALREWTRRFGGDTEEWQDLVDRRLTTGLPPDLKLLHLLYWLDPTLPPIYRGRHLGDPKSLLGLALAGLNRPNDVRNMLGDLWRHRVLAVLAGKTGRDDLRRVDQRWRALEARFTQMAAHCPATFDETRRRSGLLALAVDEEHATAVLRESAERVRESLPAPVPWHDALMRDGEATGLLAAVLSGGDAHAEARAEIRRAEQRAAALRANEERWAEEERQREAARPQAFGWAALAFITFCAPWLLLIFLVAQGDETVAQQVTMWLVLLGVGVTEGTVALHIGGPYHPRYSLLRPLGRGAATLRGPARLMGEVIDNSEGCGGCLVMVLAILLIGIVAVAASVLVWSFILPVGVAAAYGIWTLRRWMNWKREHQAARDGILGGGT